MGLTLHGPFFYHGFRFLDARFGASVNLRMVRWRPPMRLPAGPAMWGLRCGCLERQVVQWKLCRAHRKRSCTLQPCSPSFIYLQATVKACAGNFTIFPLYLGSFFLYMGLLEGLTPPQAVQKLRQAFAPT